MATKRRTTRTTRKTRARTTRTSSTRGPRPPKPQAVTPYLTVTNGAEALGWYKEAFGAKEFSRTPTPDGKIMHAGFTIGGSQVFLSDEFPGSDVQAPTTVGGTTVNLLIHVKDLDKLWQRAVGAGAKVAMPLEDQFWGDRYGKLTDPFGHSWGFVAKAKMSKGEIERRTAEAMRQFGG